MVWWPFGAEPLRASHREEAEFLRLCLVVGLIDVAAVVAWADGIIADDPEPPAEIIDVALLTKAPADEVARALERVRGFVDGPDVALQLLGLVRRRLANGMLTLAEAARALDRLSVWARLPEPANWQASLPHYQLERARNGRGDQTPEQVRLWTEEFLARNAREDRLGPRVLREPSGGSP